MTPDNAVDEDLGDELDIMNVDVTDAPELSILEEGEYKVEIRTASLRRGKDSGNLYISVCLEALEGGDLARDVYHTIFLPSEDRTTKQNARTAGDNRKFVEAFGLPGAINKDAIRGWPGAQGWAFLSVENDNKGVPQNRVRSFVRAK